MSSQDLIDKISSQDVTEFLIRAIENNDTETVVTILSKHSKLASAGQLFSPLWMAAALGHEKIVEILIKAGAKVNEKINSGRYTLLHWMSRRPSQFHLIQAKVGDILILYKADVNYNVSTYGTPLQYAIHNGNVEWAEFLLKKGARLKGPEWQNEPPATFIFTKPCIKNRKDILRLLLKNGLGFSSQLYEGENLLQEFIGRPTPYIYEKDAKEIVETLIDCGISPNLTDARGGTPLYIAIMKQSSWLISCLIDKGADVDHKIPTIFGGDTPLCVSMMFRNPIISDLLISKGAKINEQSSHGFTALHGACDLQDEKMISLLIKRGADISILDNAGRTPLDNLESNKCMRTLIKEYLKLNFESPLHPETFMKFLQKNSKAQDYYDKCTAELGTKFYQPYTYYSIIKMSRNIKKLANLLRNEEFVTSLEKKFSHLIYKNDLERIIHKAHEVKVKQELVYSRLYSTFGKLLPGVVIKNLSEHLKVEDLPS